MIKYKVSDIKKLVKESIDEMKVSPFGAASPVQTQAQQQVQAAPNNKLEKDSDEGKYDPVVGYCHLKKDENGNYLYHLGLLYIFDQHSTILQNLVKKMTNKIQIFKTGRSSIEIVFAPDMLNDIKGFIERLPKLLNYAASQTRNTKYNQEALQEFVSDIIKKLDNTPTVDELEQFESSVPKTWREMEDMMNNPSIFNLIKNIGTYYANVDEDLDEKLTDRNKAMIFVQDRNATYVTQEVGWNRLNREVIDPSRFILFLIPSKKYVPKDIKEKVASMMGFGNYANYKIMKRDEKNNLKNSGIVHKFEMLCQQLSPGNVFFYYAKAYDVANTKVIDGMEDYFETRPRYINNLFGIPNSVANLKKAEIEAKKKNQIATNPTPAPTTARTESMLRNAFYIIEKEYRNIKDPNDPQILETNNVGEDIGNAINKLELKRAVKNYGIPRVEEQEIFAVSIAACVSAALGLNNSMMSQFFNKGPKPLRKTDTMTDDEARDAFGEFNGIISAITSKKGREIGKGNIVPLKLVAENIMNENITFDEFKNFLQQGGIEVVDGENIKNNVSDEIMNDNISNEMMKESFFEMLDKIENRK